MRRGYPVDSHDGHFGFCPVKSQLYRAVGKPEARRGRRLRVSCSWQIAGDRLIDDPRPEDGTDFSSYAAGASPDISWCDCRGVVVAGRSHLAAARPDRSQRQADVRVLRAVPRRPDAAVADHPCRGGTDYPGSGAVSYTHLRAHETDSYLVCRLLLE